MDVCKDLSDYSCGCVLMILVYCKKWICVIVNRKIENLCDCDLCECG
jgi:hypothetical protein